MTEDDQQDTATVSWTRRTLLRWSGVAALTLVAPNAALGRTLYPVRRVGDPLLRSSYNGLVGQHFWVEKSPRSLALVSVEDLNASQAGSENAFALIFTGPPVLISQVPQIYHPALGTFRFLLSPGPAAAQSRTYVAVINRD